MLDTLQVYQAPHFPGVGKLVPDLSLDCSLPVIIVGRRLLGYPRTPGGSTRPASNDIHDEDANPRVTIDHGKKFLLLKAFFTALSVLY